MVVMIITVSYAAHPTEGKVMDSYDDTAKKITPAFLLSTAAVLYYTEYAQWPTQINELKQFSKKKNLRFEPSKFNRIDFSVDKENNLIINFILKKNEIVLKDKSTLFSLNGPFKGQIAIKLPSSPQNSYLAIYLVDMSSHVQLKGTWDIRPEDFVTPRGKKKTNQSKSSFRHN